MEIISDRSIIQAIVRGTMDAVIFDIGLNIKVWADMLKEGTDPNSMVPLIIEAAEKSTPQPFSIDGEVVAEYLPLKQAKTLAESIRTLTKSSPVMTWGDKTL